MRKNAKYVIATLLSLCIGVNVNAAQCSYERQVELGNLAATVKTTYEAKEIETGEKEEYIDEEGIIHPDQLVTVKKKAFEVKVLNLTEDLYIIVTDQNTGDTKKYYYEDSKEGTVNLGTKTADEIRVYNIQVNGYGGDCSGRDLRTINLIVPKYNEFSEYSICRDYPNFEYCQEYTTDDTYTFSKFVAAADAYKKNHPKDEQQNERESNLTKFIKKNKKMLIIVGTIILIAGVAAGVIIVIKRRSRLI